MIITITEKMKDIDLSLWPAISSIQIITSPIYFVVKGNY